MTYDPCDYVERTLRNLLYKSEYLGVIGLSEVRRIFQYMKEKELDKCIKKLVGSSRGWELRRELLVNREVINDLLRKIGNPEVRIKECEEKLTILKKEEEVLEIIGNLWIEKLCSTSDITVDERNKILAILNNSLSCERKKITRCKKIYEEHKRVLENFKRKIEESFQNI